MGGGKQEAGEEGKERVVEREEDQSMLYFYEGSIMKPSKCFLKKGG
jgi:hypothetical protein